MDYEKKYNDALDWMRKIYPTLTGATKEDAEHYFSELNESKDERIRTRLIALVEAFGQGKYKDEMLAYLEKQKDSPMPEDTVIFQKGVAEGRRLEREEQKPAEWSEEDEKMIDLIIAIFKVNHPNGHFKANKLGDPNISVVYTEEIVAWLKSLRPQPHWKPSKEQMEALKSSYSVLKAHDTWSEDEHLPILMSLINDLQKLL